MPQQPLSAIPDADADLYDAEATVSPDLPRPAQSPARPRPAFARFYRIRPFAHADADACRALYRVGLLGGQLSTNDTGLDVEDVPAAYLADPLNGFWVACVTEAAAQFEPWLPEGCRAGDIIGMIGVQHHDQNVGEIRRLRVHPAHQRRGVGSRLLETAIRFCRETGSLKVQLDSWVNREPALRLFERFGFRHSRTRQINGRDLLYFYLDLYTNREKR